MLPTRTGLRSRRTAPQPIGPSRARGNGDFRVVTRFAQRAEGLPQHAAPTRVRPSLEIVPDPATPSRRFAATFPVLALVLVLLASTSVVHVLRSGQRTGQWTPTTSLLNEARPLPDF